jgi:riboflavin synthase
VFTGIVEEVGKVASIPAGGLVISAGKILQGMELGSSIAVNGVCLTVNGFDSRSFTVDVMPETLRRTNLGKLSTGGTVNLERALALGGHLGGHLVQGHVDDTGTLISVTMEGEALLMKFEAPAEVMRFLVLKGFIAVDGVSLTTAARDTFSFTVSIVGFTRENTILGSKRPGDTVNLEVDIIAKYVEQLYQPQTTGITMDFLQEHGFSISAGS